MDTCAPHVCSTHRSQKRVSDFLELELYTGDAFWVQGIETRASEEQPALSAAESSLQPWKF